MSWSRSASAAATVSGDTLARMHAALHCPPAAPFWLRAAYATCLPFVHHLLPRFKQMHLFTQQPHHTLRTSMALLCRSPVLPCHSLRVIILAHAATFLAAQAQVAQRCGIALLGRMPVPRHSLRRIICQPLAWRALPYP